MNRPSDVVPHNDKDAEKALLGCAIRDREALSELTAMIDPDDFYHFAHAKIWEALCYLAMKDQPIDVVTIADRLKEMDVIDDIGGPAYLVDVWEGAPAIVNYAIYADIVRRMAIRRELCHAALAIQKSTFDLTATKEELIEDAEKLLCRISQRNHGGNQVVSMDKAVSLALDEIDRRQGKAGGEVSSAIPSPWAKMDELIGGFYSGDLVVIAARPSVGKTLFALIVALHAAAKGNQVFFASLEQSTVELALRSISRQGPVNSYSIRRGAFTAAESLNIIGASEALSPLPFHLDDTGRQPASRIISNARRLKARCGLDMVVVDYLQIMDAEDKRAMRYEQVGLNALRMKQLAKELKVPVLLLAQLGRGAENRAEGRPKLSDLRESGDIECHADSVMLLWKPDLPDATRELDPLKILVEKQRNGPVGEVSLVHKKKFFDIVDPDDIIPQAFI